MMRTRNFSVRNEVVERGSLTKSKKEREACVERKVRECFQWKVHGQCSKGDSCSFSHDTQASGNRGGGQRQRTIVFSCIPFEGKTDWRRGTKKSTQWSGKNEESSLDKSEIPCRYRICKNRHVNSGILSCVKTRSLKKDVFMATNAISDMLRQKESPAKGQRKVVRTESTQLGCVSQCSYPRKSFPRELGILERNIPSNSPRAPDTIKFGKETVYREEISQSVHLMSVVFARQNSVKDHMRRLCTKKDAPAKQRVIWRQIFQAQEFGKTTFFTPSEAKVMPAPTSTRPEERESVVDSGASMHMMSKNDLSSKEFDTLRRSRTPRGSTSFRSRF